MNIEKYTKKNGTTAYRFRIYVGRVNNKDKYIKRAGFATKREARNAMLTIMDKLEEQEETPLTTFGEATKKWLNEYYETVQESTYLKTERMLKNHILPKYENDLLDDITPLKLQNQMLQWSKELSSGRKFKGIISNIYKYAIRHGYTKKNPTTNLALPINRQNKKKDKDFYNKDELLALTWSDWDNKTLDINKAVTRSLSGLEIGSTKTSSSQRLVSLDEKTIQILKAYLTETTGKGLMFQSDNGGIMTPSLPRKWLHQILDKQDLRTIKIHGFRHTHASLCFDAGMTLKQVQYRLGHSDLKTTMNVYTHITTQAKDDIGERFSKFIDF